MTTTAALLARKTWRTLEPLHGAIYFVPEAAEAYARLGITGPAGYFASRAAPMGAVPADVVVSTFFNFNPELVQSAIPERVGLGLARGRGGSAVRRRRRRHSGACSETTCCGSAEMAPGGRAGPDGWPRSPGRTEGRPLAAGHADLAWPEPAHLVLWHAQSILREYRGDGHIALLVTHGLSGIDALVTHAAAGDVPAHLLRSTRGWSAEAVGRGRPHSMRARGWLTEADDLAFTEWGAAQRQEIEAQTDLLATAPYEALGEERCAELRTLARPWSKTFSEVLFHGEAAGGPAAAWRCAAPGHLRWDAHPTIWSARALSSVG